ncbi:MAG TPA: patatin-like phospholipase family protein [Anaerolineales bacterium]
MQYDMVFEGGGAKGMVFVGALQEVESRGYIPSRLLGASAGAIMATFLAAGYQSAEMAEALNETDEEDRPVFLGFLETPPALTQEEIQRSAIRQLLRDVNLKFVPDFAEDKLDDAIANALATSSVTGRLCSFIERGGFYAAENFLAWLGTKLNSGIYALDRGAHPKSEPRRFGHMNLAEFHTATGTDLSLVASDTSAAQIMILNHRTAPDCPVIWAVRMSMSFPLLWHEVVWQPEWGTYRGENVAGHSIVDGGMLSNFPIELFLSDQPHVTAVMGDKTTEALNVMGFLIDEAVEVPGAPVGAAQSEVKSFDFSQLQTIDRVKKLINTMTQAHDKIVIDAFERFVVRLPAKGYGTIEFGMSEERRAALVAAGRQVTAKYLDRMESLAAGGVSFGLESAAETRDLQSAADRIAGRILSH